MYPLSVPQSLALYHRPSNGGALSLGPGAFIAALEAASHRKPSSTIVCGKPSQAFLRECIAGMIGENEDMVNYNNIIVGRLCDTRPSDSDPRRSITRGSIDIAYAFLVFEQRCRVETEQIGDDIDADLGEGTWDVGLRRVLGE